MKTSSFFRLSLLALWGLASGQAADARGSTVADLVEVQQRVQSQYDRVQKAVVTVQAGGATGSGVIINPAGLILTAAHVIGGAKQKVNIVLHDGRSVEATALGKDTTTDAAMLQLPKPAKAWPYASIALEVRDLTPGQWCFAIGNPGGWDAARGPVLRIGKLVKVAANMVQSDCVLMGGDSGGGLFNLKGEVIGIHSQIWHGRDQNMHVSMAPFLRSWDAMKEGDTVTQWGQGNGAYAGVSTQGTDDGLLVQMVAPGSPAMKAGLKQGDVILALNNRKIGVPADFSAAIRSRRVGELITLKVRTGGTERVLEVKLEKKPGAGN